MSTSQRDCRAKGGEQHCRFHNADKANKIKSEIGEKHNQLMLAVPNSLFGGEEEQTRMVTLREEIQELEAEYDATETGLGQLLDQIAQRSAAGKPYLELQIRRQLALARMEREENLLELV